MGTERVDILLAIYDAVKTISIENGYQNAIGTTSPEYLNFEDVKTFPGVFVWCEGLETRTEGWGDSEECTMEAHLQAYVRSAKVTEESVRARESIIEDLRRLVRSDRSWGGTAAHTRITDIEVRSDGIETAIRIGLSIDYVYTP